MARKLVVEIVGDASSLQKTLQKATGAFSGSVAQWAKGAIVFRGVNEAVDGLSGALRAGISEFADQQRVAAQTNAVLKSTHSIAGLTAQQIDKLAATISNYSGMDDEAIQSGENLLLTFTNLRDVAGKNNDIFTQTTKLTADLSVAMGMSMTQAALQLGKALNDPARGYARLQRIGVAFDESQKKAIKSLTATGNVMGAQKVILAELTKEFGGSAKAAGDTLPGQLNRLRETFRNLAGEIVGNFAPAIDKNVRRLADWISNTENQERIMRDLDQAVSTVKGVIKDLTPTFEAIAGAAKKTSDALGGAKHSLELLIALAAAWKATSLINSLNNIGTAAAGANGKGGAAGKVGRLSTSLTTLKNIGAITLAIEVVMNTDKIDAWMQKHGLPSGKGGLWGWLFGGGDPPTPKLPGGSGVGTGAVGAITSTTAAGVAQQNAVVGFAQRFGPGSGVVYHWSGVSPQTGFDCSGYLWAAYKAAGITIPRDTRSQWNDPSALQVPPGQERPGDGVYFVGSLSGQNQGPPPGHVGIYIGDGKFIEYFSEGKPARVSDLGSRGDYMGARRWLKLKTSGGGGGGTSTRGGAVAPTATSGTAKTKAKAKATPSFELPVSIREGLATAALTAGTADDMTWLRKAQKFIEDKISSLKNPELRTQAKEALKGVNEQIQDIEDAANDKRAKKDAAAQKKQQERWKQHLERLKQIVQAKRSAFEDVFQSIAEKGMEAFDRATQAGLDKINATFDQETDAEKALREFRDHRAADERAQERADAMAIEDPTERAARLRELDLEDQEAALEAAADASRKARDDERQKAIDGYENQRQIARDQLDLWLKEQESRLESGKTQWSDFWDALVKRAGLAGTDVASAFWQQFQQAGGQAAAALGALSDSKLAQAVLPQGSTTGGSTRTGYVVGGIVIQPPKMAAGGIVRKPTLAIIGEKGPEAVVPLGRGLGTPTININVAGSVVTERELALVVRNEFTKIQRGGGKI